MTAEDEEKAGAKGQEFKGVDYETRALGALVQADGIAGSLRRDPVELQYYLAMAQVYATLHAAEATKEMVEELRELNRDGLHVNAVTNIEGTVYTAKDSAI